MSAHDSRNPYRPGVGLQPTYLAGRDGDIDTFANLLSGAPEIPANAKVTGLRGVGKTVLLRELQSTAEKSGWSALGVELEPRHCSEEALSGLLQTQTRQLKEALSTFQRIRNAVVGAGEVARRATKVSYEGFTWSAAGDLDPRTKELAELLLDATDFALDKGKHGLMLFFDEAQILVDSKDSKGDHALSSLIASISTLQKQNVPIGLVMCGLPTLAVNLLGARTYTERMFRGFKVGSLKPHDARAALTVPLTGTPIDAELDLIERVIADVDGYPYFIQLWGAELWDTTTKSGLKTFTVSTLEQIEKRIQERLDLDFYSPRIDSLTPAEQDLLLASASCAYPPLRVSDLNGTSPKSNQNVNVLLGRLVKANILFRPRKGEYRYTAPKFRDFLIRRNAAGGEDDY